MNRQQPVPTLLQRQALAAYLDARRDVIYQAERARVLHRVVVTDQPATETRKPNPEAGHDPLFTRAEAVIFALLIGASVGVYFADFMGWLA